MLFAITAVHTSNCLPTCVAGAVNKPKVIMVIIIYNIILYEAVNFPYFYVYKLLEKCLINRKYTQFHSASNETNQILESFLVFVQTEQWNCIQCDPIKYASFKTNENSAINNSRVTYKINYISIYINQLCIK